MVDPGLFASLTKRLPAATVFSRAARISLVGLLAPGAITALAASLGYPLPSLARTLLDVLPVVAFAASGALAAKGLGGDRRTTAWLVVGFAIAGLMVSPAYGSLQGLTGRESVVVVMAIVVSAFAAGFAAAATTGAIAMRHAGWTVAGVARRGAVAGALGGLLALGPFLLAAARLPLQGPYISAALAVASFLGCVIVPYRMIGFSIDQCRPDTTESVHA